MKENVPNVIVGNKRMVIQMIKIKPDEVRDELITIYCNEVCKESAEDGHCPDHSCLVWKLLNICLDEEHKKSLFKDGE